MLSNGKAQEGENVFGNGSMTGIAVTLFIKNPNVSGDCKIYYHDIGNNLTTKENLQLSSILVVLAALRIKGLANHYTRQT